MTTSPLKVSPDLADLELAALIDVAATDVAGHGFDCNLRYPRQGVSVPCIEVRRAEQRSAGPMVMLVHADATARECVWSWLDKTDTALRHREFRLPLRQGVFRRALDGFLQGRMDDPPATSPLSATPQLALLFPIPGAGSVQELADYLAGLESPTDLRAACRRSFHAHIVLEEGEDWKRLADQLELCWSVLIDRCRSLLDDDCPSSGGRRREYLADLRAAVEFFDTPSAGRSDLRIRRAILQRSLYFNAALPATLTEEWAGWSHAIPILDGNPGNGDRGNAHNLEPEDAVDTAARTNADPVELEILRRVWSSSRLARLIHANDAQLDLLHTATQLEAMHSRLGRPRLFPADGSINPSAWTWRIGSK